MSTRLENGLRAEDVLASTMRVWRKLRVACGYPEADLRDDGTEGGWWWRWLTSFLVYLGGEQGSFSPRQQATDARCSYAACRGLPADDPLFDEKYLDVCEACVRHVFSLMDIDYRLPQDDLAALEEGWEKWLAAKGKDKKLVTV